MHEFVLLGAALLSSVCGMAWFALGMKVHWQQVRGDDSESSAATTRVLRALGFAALLLSFVLCFTADHPSIAVLVWVMSIAAAALTITFTLSWRPRLLAWLVVWAR